ncbi:MULTISPECIES: SAM-dependent methyltransferase [unclassified Frankia]|uniref:SAM-dependent methyltransferase n=1 Tax=unclassified Frankia TaxID=2632575 RepID=UPI0020248F91
MSAEWYTRFFTELPNEFWRRAATPELTAADIAFVERHLGLAAGSRILDAPCGSGRHSLALAALGHHVTGIDISAEAVGHARREAARAGLDVRFTQADMRSIPRSASFDAAVCLGNSFGYLNTAGTREFVAALAGALLPGGGLVIDFSAAAETVLPGYSGQPRTMRTGDIKVETTTEYDVDESCLISRYRFSRGSEVVDATALHRVYTSRQLGELLTDGGFTGIERYAGPDGAPYQLGSSRLMLVARRT